MPTAPPTSTAAPAQLPQRGIKATFNGLMDAWVTWFSTKAAVEVPALATNTFNNATEAAQSASTASTAATTATSAAAAAVATANATLWSSGVTVPQNANVISPLDRQTYRRKTAAGSGTTDPALDPANYVLVSVGPSAMALLGSATVGSAVAYIDFLNIFSDVYLKYVIEIVGIAPAASDSLALQLAVAGVANTTGYSNGSGTFNQPCQVVATGVSGLAYTIEILGARQAAPYKGISANGIAVTGSGAGIGSAKGGWSNNSIASGFRLLWFAGTNFTAGSVRVYGVRA